MLVASVVVLAGLLIFFAVRQQGHIEEPGRASRAAIPAPESVAPAPDPAPATPAAPAPAAIATVELPPKGFSIADVLGKTKRDVDRALGHGEQLEDGPWDYGFGKVAVLVAFEAGRAVFVSVTAPEFHNTETDRTAVLAWMQAPPGSDFDHTHNFDFELGIWAPGAQDRQLVRRAVAEAVTDGLRSSGGGGTAAANYTRLEVSLPNESSCTRAVLAELVRKHALKSAGFESLECLTMSANPPILQLR